MNRVEMRKALLAGVATLVFGGSILATQRLDDRSHRSADERAPSVIPSPLAASLVGGFFPRAERDDLRRCRLEIPHRTGRVTHCTPSARRVIREDQRKFGR